MIEDHPLLKDPEEFPAADGRPGRCVPGPADRPCGRRARRPWRRRLADQADRRGEAVLRRGGDLQRRPGGQPRDLCVAERGAARRRGDLRRRRVHRDRDHRRPAPRHDEEPRRGRLCHRRRGARHRRHPRGRPALLRGGGHPQLAGAARAGDDRLSGGLRRHHGRARATSWSATRTAWSWCRSRASTRPSRGSPR